MPLTIYLPQLRQCEFIFHRNLVKLKFVSQLVSLLSIPSPPHIISVSLLIYGNLYSFLSKIISLFAFD